MLVCDYCGKGGQAAPGQWIIDFQRADRVQDPVCIHLAVDLCQNCSSVFSRRVRELLEQLSERAAPRQLPVPSVLEMYSGDTPSEPKSMNKLAPFEIPPGPPGICPECGVEHKPGWPHDRDSCFYQYDFFNRHGRWPEWQDALAHCTPEMQQAWEAELRQRGAW